MGREAGGGREWLRRTVWREGGSVVEEDGGGREGVWLWRACRGFRLAGPSDQIFLLRVIAVHVCRCLSCIFL